MTERSNVFVKAALAALMALAIILVITLVFKLNSLKTQRDTLSAEAVDRKLELEQLNEELGRDFDEEYIKKVAREKLGYRMPDEIIYYNDLNK